MALSLVASSTFVCPGSFTITGAQPQFQSFAPASSTAGTPAQMTIVLSNLPLPPAASCTNQASCMESSITVRFAPALSANLSSSAGHWAGTVQTFLVQQGGTGLLQLKTPAALPAGDAAVILDLGSVAGG